MCNFKTNVIIQILRAIYTTLKRKQMIKKKFRVAFFLSKLTSGIAETIFRGFLLEDRGGSGTPLRPSYYLQISAGKETFATCIDKMIICILYSNVYYYISYKDRFERLLGNIIYSVI